MTVVSTPINNNKRKNHHSEAMTTCREKTIFRRAQQQQQQQQQQIIVTPQRSSSSSLKFTTPTPSLRRRYGGIRNNNTNLQSTVYGYNKTTIGRRLRYNLTMVVHHVDSSSSTNNKKMKTTAPSAKGDPRFIPNRNDMKLDLCRMKLFKDDNNKNDDYEDDYYFNIVDEEKPINSESESTMLEYNRRLLSSLCNVPINQLNEHGQVTSMMNFKQKQQQQNPKQPQQSNYGGAVSSSSSSASVPINPDRLDTLRVLQLFDDTDGHNDKKNNSYDDDFDPVGMSLKRRMVQDKNHRPICTKPIDVKDCPDFLDDFYLNLVSWSKDNVLAVALYQQVWLYNCETHAIAQLVEYRRSSNGSSGESLPVLYEPDEYVTSLEWCTQPEKTHYLLVGSNRGVIYMYDTIAMAMVTGMNTYRRDISTLSWNNHTSCFASGGAKKDILIHDIRIPCNVVSIYRGHDCRVCSLKWDVTGKTLASGGNDNTVCIWDAAMSSGTPSSDTNSIISPRLQFRGHRGAIKALDWCPYSTGTIASGGGRADTTIKVWNTNNGNVSSSTLTGSQVTSVLWSQHYHQRGELVSAHQTGELHLWKYSKQEATTTSSGSYLTHKCGLDGHNRRILNLVMSPNGGIVASVGGDERLKMWNVFGGCDDRSTSIRRGLLSHNGILPNLGLKPIR